MAFIQQQTPEWFAARCGKATASRMSDILARTQKGYGASRANYAAQLVRERLTGVPDDSFISPAMQWGIDKEDEAKSLYAFEKGVSVAPGGFIEHPAVPMSGASPDGLVGDLGLVECKCPLTATHIETLLKQKVPDKYLAQINWQLACTGRLWCDFVSYDPRMPAHLRLFEQRIHRTDDAIRLLENEVTFFLKDVDATLKRLNALGREAA